MKDHTIKKISCAVLEKWNIYGLIEKFPRGLASYCFKFVTHVGLVVIPAIQCQLTQVRTFFSSILFDDVLDAYNLGEELRGQTCIF